MKFQLVVVFTLLFVLANAQSKQIIVHDPVAIEADGKYYLFNTGRGIAFWQSDDMENWNFVQPVFKESPKWAKEEVPRFDGNIWAPDITFHNGKYYLYYSISSFGSNRSAIGVVTNETLNPDDPNFKWVDHGPVIESVRNRDDWNAIDPNLVFDDEGTPWFSFGSFWGGLKLFKMNDDLLSMADPQEWYTIATRSIDSGSTAIEAPFIFKKNGYYYLFVSWDMCCRGENSTYNVRVGRSESVKGPYLDKDGISMSQGGGTLVVKGDENYYGIGHNSAYTFNDTDYMFSHGYDAHDRGRSKLVRHEILWDEDGWPTLKELK